MRPYKGPLITPRLPGNTIVAIAIVAASAISMVLANLQGANTVAIVFKMTASSAFIAVAISRGALRSRYGRTILFALVFSWLGDLLLARQAEALFLFGLASFLLAHCVYTVAFAGRGIFWRRALLALLPIALVSGSVTLWLADFVPANMAVPVHLYTVVISTMVIAAFATRAAASTRYLPIGALLFYFSDLSVATAQFVPTDFPHYVWGLPFYFAGQTLLAISVGDVPEPRKRTL